MMVKTQAKTMLSLSTCPKISWLPRKLCTQNVPADIEKTEKIATAGMIIRIACCALPLKKGIKNAPDIKSIDG
jgi:hypothetical protein